LGEPTLAQNLPGLVAEVRRHFALPVVLLTGSGLIARADVRRDLSTFDSVAAKLDAPDAHAFRHINCPMSGYPYPFSAIVEGIHQFRQAYTGRLILQMMFLRSNAHLAAQMASLARPLQADEIQLNTPLQPALGEPLSATEMREVGQAFAGLPTTCIYDRDQARITPRSI
jgi:wyosine [tRNA(Phe)-imidazoG37] synthetase (radical SAM superfamily)